MIFLSHIDRKDRKKVIAAAMVPLLIGIIILVVNHTSSKPDQKTLNLPERNDTVPQVSVMINYGTKIVYTSDVTSPKDDYIGDCKTRGGTFNACGTEMCATSCAFTCELK